MTTQPVVATFYTRHVPTASCGVSLRICESCATDDDARFPNLLHQSTNAIVCDLCGGTIYDPSPTPEASPMTATTIPCDECSAPVVTDAPAPSNIICDACFHAMYIDPESVPEATQEELDAYTVPKATRQYDPIGTVFVGIDRCGIAVRSNQHGAYILERERSRYNHGRTVDTRKSEYFPTRDAALREWFSPYAFPGGYPVAFYSLAGNDFSDAGDLDGDVFCGDCAREFYQDQRQQFIRESTDGWEAETRNMITCANCYQHIAEPQCVRCYGDIEEENIADGICARCQRDERGPRYHVIAGISGYMPDYHSADGDPDNEGMTLAEAIADAEDYVTGACGLTEAYPDATFEKSDDGRVYRVDVDPESPTRLPWYVEVVEVND